MDSKSPPMFWMHLNMGLAENSQPHLPPIASMTEEQLNIIVVGNQISHELNAGTL
ncbi:hypothetical protein K3495_g9414 [Podosphaera aphanis]|nr:hypothetical protein K3495_g9414 [Podosphaera aphanis]